MLFQHEGWRSLWPVVFFLPWFLVGVAYLVAAMVHGRREVSALSVPVRRSLQTSWSSRHLPLDYNVGCTESWLRLFQRTGSSKIAFRTGDSGITPFPDRTACHR